MRRMHLVGTGGLLCGLALWAGAAMAADKAVSAGECFSKGFKAGDADAVAACYAEDGILWFPGGSMAKGRAAIRDGFAHFFTEVTVRDVVMSEIGHVASGDTRSAWGTYAITVADKATGKETVQRGRYTDVSRKVGNRWLYVVDHPSDDPPAAGQH